jgi:molybdopterin synthase catalytic subunit
MSALGHEPLDLAAALTCVGDPEHGGTAVFVGTTRRELHAREVSAIEYEAHGDLAEREIARICEEARHRHGARVVAKHRLGRVAVGEPSVVVAASAPHRAEAFAACRLLIDDLKRRVPIWKRVHYADGGAEWIDGTAQRDAGRSASTG